MPQFFAEVAKPKRTRRTDRPSRTAEVVSETLVATNYLVQGDHPSGSSVNEYGVNAFWFADESEAKAKAAELTNATVKCQRKYAVLRKGQRYARDRAWSWLK